MLTTAGILCSSMGAKEGRAWPSTKGGKPAADASKVFSKLVEIIDDKNNFLIKAVFIKLSQRLLNTHDRQYKTKKV